MRTSGPITKAQRKGSRARNAFRKNYGHGVGYNTHPRWGFRLDEMETGASAGAEAIAVASAMLATARARAGRGR